MDAVRAWHTRSEKPKKYIEKKKENTGSIHKIWEGRNERGYKRRNWAEADWNELRPIWWASSRPSRWRTSNKAGNRTETISPTKNVPSGTPGERVLINQYALIETSKFWPTHSQGALYYTVSFRHDQCIQSLKYKVKAYWGWIEDLASQLTTNAFWRSTLWLLPVYSWNYLDGTLHVLNSTTPAE